MQKEYRRAFYALKEAAKYQYENWQLWDNICTISLRVKSYFDTMLAIGRVLDIKKAFDDWQVLGLLVRGILEKTGSDESVAAEDPAAAGGGGGGGGDEAATAATAVAPTKPDRAKVKMLADFKALLERVMTESKIGTRTWGVCAEFFNAVNDTERGLECRRTAYQEAKAVDNWELDDGAVVDVADAVIAFVEDQLASNACALCSAHTRDVVALPTCSVPLVGSSR
jgi:hypothetical protein